MLLHRPELSVPIKDSSYLRLPDDEIFKKLETFQPVNSEKNVWAFWDKGFSSAPPWCQRNVLGWIRRLGPSWTVRVVDWVDGSLNNVTNFVPIESFPAPFVNRTMTGRVGTQSSDVVRLPLVLTHGGVWIDIGTMLFRDLDTICWNSLEDPESPYEICMGLYESAPGVPFAYNGFVAARKGNDFIRNWHNIYVALWEGSTSHEGMHTKPLLRPLPQFQHNEDMPKFSKELGPFLDYLSHILSFERLRRLKDPKTGFNGAHYFHNNIILLDALQEIGYSQHITDWDGRKQFNLLSAPIHSDSDKGLCEEASKFVQDILSSAAMMKLSHAFQDNGKEWLSTLWDSAENNRADMEPGTFASLLRYGSENWEQIREMNLYVLKESPEPVIIDEVTGEST